MEKKEYLTLGAALLVGLGLSEALVRRFASPPRYQQVADSQTHVSNGGSGAWLYLSTPSGRRLRPNVQGTIRRHFVSGRDIPMRTNSLGFRGPEPRWDRHPRVLFLGDSVTLADYLPEEETFVHGVGTELGWETFNSGVGSIGLGTERAILQEMGPRVAPHRVVLNLYLNDVDSSPAIELLPVPGLLKVSWLAQHAYQAASTFRYLLSEQDPAFARKADWDRWRQELQTRYPAGPGDWRRDRPAFNGLIHQSWRDWGAAWSPQAVEKMLREASAIEATARSLGARFDVVIHPARPQVEAEFVADEPQQQLIAGFRAQGVEPLDLLPALRAAYRETPHRLLFHDQCHHTPEGARVVTQAMVQWQRGLR